MKKILLILPTLSPAGGIHAAVELVQVIKQLEYQIDVISYCDGLMRQTFEKLGATVTITENMFTTTFVKWASTNYDEYFINTLQLHVIMNNIATENPNKRIFWWIHEPPMYFVDEAANQREFWDDLPSNVQVLAVGAMVRDYILEKFNYSAGILNFCVDDVANQVELKRLPWLSKKSMVILIPSFGYQYIKGQDIMAVAIDNLPQEYLEKCQFIFLGRRAEGEEEIDDMITLLAMKHKNVAKVNPVEHSELLHLIKQSDCIVTPSREDSMNTCIIEGLMLSKICLLSDRCGVAMHLQDCVNSFIFQSENVVDLMEHFMIIIDNYARLENVKKNGRAIYEKYFLKSVFEKNVKELLL
jgi:glycosyltransferase involved in cell wall biosynthesis